jgi:hypothetical protein
VLALCEFATIRTTSGSVIFGRAGRAYSKERTEHGSVFHGALRMTLDELDRARVLIRSVIVPADVVLTLDGEAVPSSVPIGEFGAALPTEIIDEEGHLRRTTRRTTVRVYERAGAAPGLYELGIPVMPFELGEPWHVDVGQKVPLTLDRTTVLPSFLRTLQVELANEMRAQIVDATAPWVREAVSDGRVRDDVVRQVTAQRFGAKAVAYDPSDPEANKLATAMGYTVVTGGAASRDEWANIKRLGLLLPAGRITPSSKAYGDGPPAAFRDEVEWTSNMRAVAEYAQRLARRLLLGLEIRVRFNQDSTNFAAAWCSASPTRPVPELHFALASLGEAWFSRAVTDSGKDALHELLLHEMAHFFSPDHLSSDFHEATCRLGAKLARLALEEPESFRIGGDHECD